MAYEGIKVAGKNGLPGIITGVACGYATLLIPILFPEGDLRKWAYSSIPFLSLCVLFILRVIRDIGSMSVKEIAYLKFVAAPEKRQLRSIIDDTYSTQAVRDDAQKRYDQVCREELAYVQRKLKYFSSLLKSTPQAPEIPASTQGQQK